MSEDTMLVTLTIGQLKEIMGEMISQALGDRKNTVENDEEIHELKDLMRIYGISLSTASKWKKQMEKDNVIRGAFGLWSVNKYEVDEWMRNNKRTK